MRTDWNKTHWLNCYWFVKIAKYFNYDPFEITKCSSSMWSEFAARNNFQIDCHRINLSDIAWNQNQIAWNRLNKLKSQMLMKLNCNHCNHLTPRLRVNNLPNFGIYEFPTPWKDVGNTFLLIFPILRQFFYQMLLLCACGFSLLLCALGNMSAVKVNG